jgi:hypothetical protein
MPGLDLPADTWMNVLLIAIALAIAAVTSLRLSVRGWKEVLAIGVLTLPLMPLLATRVFGDVSRFLPAGMFSDGFAGKDQIIFASAFCTLFGAIILATAIVGAASKLIRALRISRPCGMR